MDEDPGREVHHAGSRVGCGLKTQPVQDSNFYAEVLRVARLAWLEFFSGIFFGLSFESTSSLFHFWLVCRTFYFDYFAFI